MADALPTPESDLRPRDQVAAFSGQGIPSGQLAELRRVARTPVVLDFLRGLSDKLAAEIEALGAVRKIALTSSRQP